MTSCCPLWSPLTSEALVAETHWPVLPRPLVHPGLAVRVGAAGVWPAQVGRGEGAAGDEWVTSNVLLQK